MTKEYKCIKEKLIMYFVIVNRLIKCFNFVDIQHVYRLENQEANELAQVSYGYRVSKEKLNDLIEVRGKVKATRLPLSDLEMIKLGSVDPENFEILAIENLVEIDWRKPIVSYLENPVSSIDRKVKYRSHSYMVIRNKLVKKMPEGVLLKFLDESETYLTVSNVHSGACGAHR
ncbi:uncharacterized protein LOC127095000 [Lathyrus oleraceus]|uniref:uncharacterized protein LOC127095000 n=1 Tax=Pisum sativum TaxID=3888 RepID=UPI0021D12C5C|nr:uncharacterized protein LOC127095000 [Pisum sativum]